MTKIITDFPNYSINTDGIVVNTVTNITKKAWLGKNGYYHVDLYHNNLNKKVAIHRLLALHFIPNPDNKRTVNHIDGDKTNNALSNLEWASDSENIQHAYDNDLNRCTTKKISEDAMDEILVRFYNGENLTTIVKDYSFSLPTLSTYLEKYVISKGELDKFNNTKKEQKFKRAATANHNKSAITGTSLTDPEDIIKFNSLSEAAKALGKSTSGPISNCLSGRQKSAYGYSWKRS